MQNQYTGSNNFYEEEHLKSSLLTFINRNKNFQANQIISFSFPLDYISPLAVFQSLKLHNKLHFYVEKPNSEIAVLAYGHIRKASYDGKSRFKRTRDFSSQCLNKIISYNNHKKNLFGPNVFTAFSFSDKKIDKSSFPSSTIFLPEWHIFNQSEDSGIVLNFRYNARISINSLVNKVIKKYNFFRTFDYNLKSNIKSKGKSNYKSKVIKTSDFKSSVLSAINDIKKNDYKKIVLSKKVTLEKSINLDLFLVLYKLREQFSSCYTFLFSEGSSKSFIGASPEKLININDGILFTEAIAGSSPRGNNVSEDAQYGLELLNSNKDLLEHNLVAKYINQRLFNLNLKPKYLKKPRLIHLPNVMHLFTDIKCSNLGDLHILDIVSELHPTPAVGGQPREKALHRIHQLEKFDRGLYCGLLGWFNKDNEGEMLVGIRSAQINKKTIEVFAGAGIVLGSEVKKEENEIALKQKPILDVLD